MTEEMTNVKALMTRESAMMECTIRADRLSALHHEVPEEH